MSSFAVKLETIEKLTKHQNADRLEIAKLIGIDYQFIVPLNRYKEGDKVLYFPIDSLLTKELQEVLGLPSKRIKTVKLRGEVSQGVVASLDELYNDNYYKIVQPAFSSLERTYPSDGDYAPIFNVKKWEPPVQVTKFAHLVLLPEFVYVYDLENAENYPEEVERLMDELVIITEKLEGSHFSATHYPNENRIAICQRRHEIKPIEEFEHTWIKIAKSLKLEEFFTSFYNSSHLYDLTRFGDSVQAVTLRGEIVGNGIACGADNIYQFKDQRVYFFEMEINGIPVNADFFTHFVDFHLPTVPVISQEKTLREWLNGRTLREASNGRSLIGETLREGIVIKPWNEIYSNDLPKNRLVLKQRDPIYLSEHGS